MKPVIRTPYFEVGTKNYVYGDKLLEYARAADAAADRMCALFTRMIESL